MAYFHGMSLNPRHLALALSWDLLHTVVIGLVFHHFLMLVLILCSLLSPRIILVYGEWTSREAGRKGEEEGARYCKAMCDFLTKLYLVFLNSSTMKLGVLFVMVFMLSGKHCLPV